MVGVALHVGERPDVAYVLPLSVDGLMVVASVAMVDDKRAGLTVRMSARVAFTVGVGASLAANIAHAEPTIGARIVSAWPAVALLLVVELLTRYGRTRKAPAAEPAPVLVETENPQVPAQIPTPVPVPEPEPATRPTTTPKPKTDQQLLRTLNNPVKVPRDPDGKVSVRRAALALGTGPDRAKRLLGQLDLLRTGDEPTSEYATVNGHDHAMATAGTPADS